MRGRNLQRGKHSRRIGAAREVATVGNEPTLVVDEFDATSDAFSRAALGLLRRKSAPLAVAVFSTVFTGDARRVPRPVLHQHVRDALALLTDRGRNVPDHDDPIALCAQWVQHGWVYSRPAEVQAGEDVYELTSDALDAMRVIRDLAKPQTVNSTRIQQVLTMVAEAAQVASGDVDTRIAHLERQIAEQTAELTRLKEGGVVAVAGDDEMVARYEQIAHEWASIPADFRRVREAIEATLRDLRESLIAGTVPGVAVHDAHASLDRVFDDTPEGRAFKGVQHLLFNDPAHLRDLRRHAGVILGHDFAEALTDGERRGFADVDTLFSDNIDMVLSAARQVTSEIAGITTRHTRASPRTNIIEAIRQAREALMAYAPRRLPAGALPMLSRAQIRPVKHTLHDPDTAPPPPDLSEYSASTAKPLDMAALARWGGPHVTRLVEHIDLLTAIDDAPVTLARAWTESPHDLRRAVEITGYLALAARMPNARHDDLGRTEVVTTVRPDGTTLDWQVPLITFTPREEP